MGIEGEGPDLRPTVEWLRVELAEAASARERLRRDLVATANERAQLRVALAAEADLRHQTARGWVAALVELQRVLAALRESYEVRAAMQRDLEAVRPLLESRQELQGELDRARDELAALRTRLVAILNSRFWRYSEGPRKLLAGLRQGDLALAFRIAQRQAAWVRSCVRLRTRIRAAAGRVRALVASRRPDPREAPQRPDPAERAAPTLLATRAHDPAPLPRPKSIRPYAGRGTRAVGRVDEAQAEAR
jgi:hypothetical protein